MAKEVGLGSTTVHRIWCAFGLKPHRTETFKLSPDPQFIEKIRDIVGLYMNPLTPTYASWVNLVERFFAEITDKAIRRGVFRSIHALKKAIMEYVDVRNEDPQPFVWTANADLILGRVQRYCERISGTGH